jgi:hypothetical protein
MLYLYLDESGDTGFDFINKKPSKFFTITILAISDTKQNRKLIKAVKKTIGIKLNRKNRSYSELKGATTVLAVKKYFFNQVKDIPFNLYALTIDKKNFINFEADKHRLYNFITRTVIDQVITNQTSITGAIEIIIDKSKNKKEIDEFNQYILLHLKSKISLNLPIIIKHEKSTENLGIQACDMFCSGIFQRYENKKDDWLSVFSVTKVKWDSLM